MSGQALARHDVAPVIHPHRVKHVLCDIDPEDVHLWFHGTRLLWLNGFTDLNSLWLIAVDPHSGGSISLRPASQASRTVAIASSRVVGPQTCPIPPPPRVRALISPSFPKVRCCMGSSLNQSQVRGEGADTHCLSGRWSIREGGPKVLICYASKRAAGRQGRAGPHCSRTVLRAGCLLIP